MGRRVVIGFGRLLAAAFAAVLVVTVAQPFAQPEVPDCTGTMRFDLTCHVRRYDTLARTAGPRAALVALKASRDTDGYVRTACHQLTHVIGRATGEQRSLADAFADGPADGGTLCSGGYFHGVVESAMARIGPDAIGSRAGDVCAPLRETASHAPLHYYCAHGMGHGLMGLHGSDIHAALAGCDLLDPWEAGHCSGGVFMENLTAVHNVQRPSRFVRPGDPLYPCAEIATRHRAECYDKQTSYAMFIAGDDVTQVFALCAAVDPADRTACDRGLGGKVAILANKYVTGLAEGAATSRAMCLDGPDPAARTDCVVGAVTAPIRDYGGTAQADALCAALRGDGLHDLCTSAREAAVATWQLPPASDPLLTGHGH